MTTSLPPMTRRLVDASTYAVLTTLNARAMWAETARPYLSVAWARRRAAVRR